MKTDIENLKKLRDFWSKTDPRLLDMEIHAVNSHEARAATPEHPCKSCMCAVGSGPSAGIPILHDETWLNYSDRVFGTRRHSEWAFLFSGRWPNSVPQLLGRLTTIIDNDVPNGWDFSYDFAD